jgi:hypothetical protein
MRSVFLAVLILVAVTFVGEAPSASQAPSLATAPECAPSGSAFMRTTLYFGLSKSSSGKVSDREWTDFLRDQVTARFPQGFTVMEGNGQWRLATGRIQRERSKVLLLVHDRDPVVRESRGNHRQLQEVVRSGIRFVGNRTSLRRVLDGDRRPPGGSYLFR